MLFINALKKKKKIFLWWIEIYLVEIYCAAKRNAIFRWCQGGERVGFNQNKNKALDKLNNLKLLLIFNDLTFALLTSNPNLKMEFKKKRGEILE